MTDEELDAIRERAARATAGPWLVGDGELDGFPGSWDVWGSDYCGIASLAKTAEAAKFPRDLEANAEFIAHARTDVPALLSEVDRLREKLSAIDGVLSKCDRGSRDRWPGALLVIADIVEEGS